MSRRVLLIRLSSLGDVLLAEPVVRALRREDPGTRTVLLTRSGYGGLFEAHPDLDSVWTLEDSGGLPALRRRVREGDFDLVVDLHRSLRSRILTLFPGIPVRRYRSHLVRRALSTARRPFKRRMPVAPVVDRYLEAAGVVIAPGPGRWPRLYLEEEMRIAGRERVETFEQGSRGVVALLPGARHAPKRWPAGHHARLALDLEQRGWAPVVVPPPDDPGTRRTVEEAAAGLPMVEGLDRPEMLGAFLAGCSGAVCNDSGPMHLAAAAGIPVVGLFGPTSPELGFAPMGTRAAFVHLGLYCSPCSRHGARPCYREKRFCMEELAPERVLEALEGLMA